MPSPKTSIGLAGAPSTEINQLNHEETEALRLTALDLTSELELEKLLDKIIKRAVELLKADGGGVYHYDENRELLTVIADCNSGHGLLGNTLRVGEGMAGQIVKNNREMIISDYSQWDGRASKLERGPFHAVVGVPLITRGKTIGVLYVLNYVEGKQFTSRDTHLLSLLASHAAIAIANAEEFEQHKRTLRQLELLNKLNERLSQALNLDQILQITLEESIKAVRADRGSIMVCDEKTKALETRAWIVQGEMMKGQGHKNFAYGEGIAGYVAVKGEAYNCEDTSKSDLFVKPSSERKIGSLLSVPIILHDRVFCIVNADNEQTKHFNDSDIKMLSTVAGHVAIAIESQMLRDVGISLSTLPLEELYPRIVESAAKLTGSEVSTIFLEDKGSDSIKRAAFFPDSIQPTEDEIRGDALSRLILDTGKLVTIHDAQNSDLVRKSVKSRDVQSLMGAPLAVRFENGTEGDLKNIGVLFVSTTRTRQYDKRDEEVLKSLANQAAIVIERTKNFAELKENVRFKESLLESAFDAIVAVNEDNRVVICNQSAERILGVNSSEAFNTDADQYFVRPKDAEKVRQMLRKDGRVVNFHTHVRSRTGEAIPIRLSVIRLEKGSVGFFQDRRELVSAKRHVTQLKQLMEAGQGITELDDKEGVFRTAVHRTIKTLNADLVSLYPYDHEQDEIQVPPIREGLRHSSGRETDLHPVHIVRKILEHDDIYFADDVQRDKLLSGSFVERERINSAVACPLKVRDKTVGIIFCSYREPHPFTDEEEKAMMRLYFSGIAIAIENARLYEEIQKRAKVVQGLYKAVLGFKGVLSPEARLRNLLEPARQLTDAKHAGLEVISSEWKVKPFTLFTGARLPAESGMLGLLIRPDTILNLSDVRRHSQYAGFLNHQPEMTSFLGVPIMLGGKSIGNFYVTNKQGGAPFNQEDEDYLNTLAGLAAVVIENAQTQDQAEAVRSLNIAFLLLAHWARVIRERIRSLKNNLAEADASLILQELKDILQEMESPIEPGYYNVKRALNQEVDISELLRDVASSSEIRDRLRKAASIIGTHKGGIRQLEGIDPYCFVTGNPTLLKLAFHILLDNAVTAIDQNANNAIKNNSTCAVRLSVSCSMRDGSAQISISDTGGGVDPEIQKDLFQVPLSGQKEGFGYGALTAGLILKVHKGEIKIKRTGPDGTVINLWLPAARG